MKYNANAVSRLKEIVLSISPANRKEWREWLMKHHNTKESVWLIYHKKGSGKPTITYSEAVDEALCFGWIDSKSKSLDQYTYIQYFTRRKPNSVWSKINKDKVERLIEQGLMADAGYQSIQRAKENGSWTILDEAEALVIPGDLDVAFERRPGSKDYFLNLSRSDKRNILQWLVLAKRQDTRDRRITEVAELALLNQKPKQFR